jgi:hypothetical protein
MRKDREGDWGGGGGGGQRVDAGPSSAGIRTIMVNVTFKHIVLCRQLPGANVQSHCRITTSCCMSHKVYY